MEAYKSNLKFTDLLEELLGGYKITIWYVFLKINLDNKEHQDLTDRGLRLDFNFVEI